jgi:hypothetical protein
MRNVFFFIYDQLPIDLIDADLQSNDRTTSLEFSSQWILN